MNGTPTSDVSPAFRRSRTRILMPRLVGTHPMDVVPRFLHFSLVPFSVSLVLSLISEFVPKYWQGIAVAAVSGQLAMTLMKLFWYVAIFLLSLAAAIKSIPRVGNIAACPFRWMGSKVAEVAFDYTSGALGVIAGIGPAVFLEHHPLGLGQVGFMLLTMLLVLFLMWFLTNLAASHFDQYVPKQIVIWLVALVFSCIVAYCFCYKEPWTETLNKCGTIAATPASAVHNPGR